MTLHLLQDSNPTLLLPRVVEEDALDDVARPEDLFGEDVQEQVVDGQIPLNAILPHLAQGQVDEVNMAALAHVVLPKILHSPHEACFVSLPTRSLPKQLLMGCRGLDGLLWGLRWTRNQRHFRVVGGCTTVEAPQGLGEHLGTEDTAAISFLRETLGILEGL